MPSVPPGKRRVLVVDDSAVIRTVVAAMLDNLGAEYDIVVDGAAAVRAVQERRYALVLLDLRMPTLDGPSTAVRIRAEAIAGERPTIVGVSGSVDDAMREACLRAGMTTILLKPLRIADLEPLLIETGTK